MIDCFYDMFIPLLIYTRLNDFQSVYVYESFCSFTTFYWREIWANDLFFFVKHFFRILKTSNHIVDLISIHRVSRLLPCNLEEFLLNRNKYSAVNINNHFSSFNGFNFSVELCNYNFGIEHIFNPKIWNSILLEVNLEHFVKFKKSQSNFFFILPI